MLILSDTCFWDHLKMLADGKTKLIDAISFSSQFRWGITPQVKQELIHFHLDEYFPLSDFFLVPVSQNEINELVRKHPTLGILDNADQSLLVAGIRDRSPIVSDDGGLIMNCLAFNLNTMYLPEFLLQSVKYNALAKKKFYQCLRFWETNCAYKQKFMKKWKKKWHEI